MSSLGTMLALLPNDGVFCRLRLRYWRSRGYRLGDGTRIFGGVLMTGRVETGEDCSIGNNCLLAGQDKGIFLGNDVMIGPNCVLVAFEHGFDDLTVPMIRQLYRCAPIRIKDDVWIGANCTITAGVTIGNGSVIGANSVVTKDVEPRSIVAGVPARVIGSRDTSEPSQDLTPGE